MSLKFSPATFLQRTPIRNETIPNDYAIKKVNLILNNITKANFNVKYMELKKAINLAHTNWLAHILLDRIGMQVNSFEIHVNLINELNTTWNATFIKSILYELTKIIDNLLPPNAMTFEKGRRLKVYGQLLGRLTLAREITIPVDLKILLFVFHKKYPKELEYIVTFVVSILRQVKYNINGYHGVNLADVWLCDNLQALKELYEISDKLIIQFEIEELFRHLGCPMSDITAAYYIRQS